jgi:hypothetical protein
MKRIILAIALSVWAAPAAAQDVLAPNPDIEATIQSQFDAFLDRDVGDGLAICQPQHPAPVRQRREFRAHGAAGLSDGLDPGSGGVHRPAIARRHVSCSGSR